MAEDAAPPETLHHHSEMDGEGPNGGLQPLRVANHLNLGKKKKKMKGKDKPFNSDLFNSTLANWPV